MVPAHALTVLARIREANGEAPPGFVPHRHFGNREQLVPEGRYLEYDVHPKVEGQNRGAERLIIDQESGRAFYTNDHYRSFEPISE